MNRPIEAPRPESAGALLPRSLAVLGAAFLTLALSSCFLVPHPAAWRVLRAQNDRFRALERERDLCGEEAKKAGTKLPKAVCVAAKAELEAWDTDEARAIAALDRSGCADLKAPCPARVGVMRGQVKDVESHRARMPKELR